MSKRIVTLLLALSMIISVLFVATSCTENKNNGGNGGSGESDEVYSVLSNETFDGANFYVLCAAEEWSSAYVVEDQSDVLSAAKYNMYNKIQDKYDVTIEHKLFKGMTAGLTSVRDALYQSVTSGSMDYDMITGGQAYVYSRISDGTLLNLEDTGIDFNQNWWCSFVNQDLKIANYMLLATGYYSLTNLSSSYVVFYNPELEEEYHLDSIYNCVRDGSWTYDELYKRCKAVMTDVNGDGNYSLDDDIIGMQSAEFTLAQLSVAFDYNICSHNDDGSITFNSNLEKLYDITTKVHDLIDGKLSIAESSSNPFPEGRTLFMLSALAAADNKEVRNMPNYTVVPMPKYDTNQNEYHTPVIADLCGIPLNVKNQIMSEALMEALNCYSYYECKDVYLNLVLKDKYSKDKDMEEMIDLVLLNPDTEFSYISADLFSSDLFYCTVWKGRNIASWIKSYKKVYEKKVEDLIETLDSNFA